MTGSVGFLAPSYVAAAGQRRFNVLIERLLVHLGFDDIRIIDGAGDGGGDILAVRGRDLFVLQTKWTSGATIDRSGVDEVERAKARFAADRAVVVTNATPDGAALRRQRELAGVGVRVDFWSGTHLALLFDEMPAMAPATVKLRPYQEVAVRALEEGLSARRRGLLVLATGLGKTVVGGEVISRFLAARPEDHVLVVAHMKELVRQLERALWRHLPKDVLTSVLTGDERPPVLEGVVCATVESAMRAIDKGFSPGLVMVDETHHVAESGTYQALLDSLQDAKQFGVTATPWRGDEYDISRRFGPASFKMGIADGMSQGYLAQADYRLYVDNLDWDAVRNTSEHGYSIRELNEKLFLPQRDEAVADVLLDAWRRTPQPRAVLFCRTIQHAEEMADYLSRFTPAWRRAACIHSGRTRQDREYLMTEFRLGRVPLVTVVDIFNEGVDIPDVNIIGFLRVTHSRRIFVQQLGRGLRLRAGKDRVIVLDFVTDLRRIAAALELKRSLTRLREEDIEHLSLAAPSTIEFNDAKVGALMEEWIKDAAALETAADEVKLQFPAVMGI